MALQTVRDRKRRKVGLRRFSGSMTSKEVPCGIWALNMALCLLPKFGGIFLKKKFQGSCDTGKSQKRSSLTTPVDVQPSANYGYNQLEWSKHLSMEASKRVVDDGTWRFVSK